MPTKAFARHGLPGAHWHPQHAPLDRPRTGFHLSGPWRAIVAVSRGFSRAIAYLEYAMVGSVGTFWRDLEAWMQMSTGQYGRRGYRPTSAL